MKKAMNLSAVFALFLSLVAMASMPSKDARVARLRRDFANANGPTNAQMKLGLDWNCTFYDTLFDKPVVNTCKNCYSFKEVAGSDGIYLNFDHSPFHANIRQFTRNDTIDTIEGSGQGETDYIRYLGRGLLIVEVTAEDSNPKLPAIANPTRLATDYGVCRAHR